MERIIAENWGVLVTAPVAFIAALCFGAVLGWIVMGLIYNQRLTHYQELISNYRDVLEDKLPARALRPFPTRRSKQMSVGLVLIFVGVGAALLGALIVSFEKPKTLTKNLASDPISPSAVAPIAQSPAPVPPVPPAVENKVLIDKTARELLALYEGRTMLQADQLIEPFKGKWIRAEGKILQLIPSGLPRYTTAVLRDGDKMISCNVGPNWNDRLLKLNSGDTLKILGKLGPSQNGQQLYLLDCELVD
jgi:hypothetical protein